MSPTTAPAMTYGLILRTYSNRTPFASLTVWGCVAEGGLAVCKVCNCYEGGLASECPGEPVSMDQQDRIYAREVDFVGGQWVNLSAATQSQ